MIGLFYRQKENSGLKTSSNHSVLISDKPQLLGAEVSLCI